MSCSIPDLKTQAVSEAVSAFIGNAKSFREVKPGVISMPVTQKFSKNRLYQIALKNAERVSKKMREVYGDRFGYGWASVNSTYTDAIEVTIRVPNELVQAWNVKLGNKTLEEVNADPNLFARDIDFYMGDQALMEQEHQNDEDFYKEFDETFTNFSRKSRYQFEGVQGEYDASSNWNHDRSKDKDVTLSDADIARIKNKRKPC